MKGSFNFNNVGLSEEQASAIWDALKRAIVEIQNGNACKLRFEELYRNAYTLVLHKHGDLVYKGVTACVRHKLMETIDIVGKASNESLLEVMVSQWELHKLVMGMVRDILMYMDKTYCKQHKKLSVYSMGLLLFRDSVVRHPSISPRLRHTLQEMVRQERMGEAVMDRVLVKNCLQMLVEVNVSSTEVYRVDFEVDFLKNTVSFYQREAQDLMGTHTCTQYLKRVEARLAEEEARADQYLDKSTKSKLKSKVQHELIVRHARRLVEDEKSGCVFMFNEDMEEDLARMYKLFAREPASLKFIRDCLSKLIKETGNTIVCDKNNAKDPKLFVRRVLATRAKFTNFLKKSFKNDRMIGKAITQSVEYFLNQDAKNAQYLSLYVDDLLRRGVKAIAEEEVDGKLDDVISIFQYLNDKDIFEDCYKKHLSTRLLTGQSANEKVEKDMIAKLKTECGHQFTSRLEGMFKDIAQSNALKKGYHEHVEACTGARPPCEMAVTVLTTGFWPVPPKDECVLPAEASATCTHFKGYYSNVHSGRRLAWQPSLGTAELKVKFAKGRKELLVSSYQMVIMMLYNAKDCYSYAEIKAATKIPEAELSRQLLSLAHPKIKILNKSPNTKAISDAHTFTFNEAYTSGLFRVKIPLLSVRAVAPSEQQAVPAGVMEGRKSRVEAAIVRVMKSRKQLDHNTLIEEVVKQLSSRFGVEMAFIKKRIESLIERDYLKRDDQNRRIYHYLA